MGLNGNDVMLWKLIMGFFLLEATNQSKNIFDPKKMLLNKIRMSASLTDEPTLVSFLEKFNFVALKV